MAINAVFKRVTGSLMHKITENYKLAHAKQNQDLLKPYTLEELQGVYYSIPVYERKNGPFVLMHSRIEELLKKDMVEYQPSEDHSIHNQLDAQNLSTEPIKRKAGRPRKL